MAWQIRRRHTAADFLCRQFLANQGAKAAFAKREPHVRMCDGSCVATFQTIPALNAITALALVDRGDGFEMKRNREDMARTRGSDVDNDGVLADDWAMTINRLFKSEMGEVRLVIKGHGALEAKTLFTLCKVGMQAALDDDLYEIEEGI